MQVKRKDSAVQLEKAEEELNIFPAFVKLLLKIIRSDAYLPIQAIGVFPDCTNTSTNTQFYLCFSKKEVDSFKESMEMVAEHITTGVMSSKYHYHFRYYCKELSSYIF